MNWRLRWLFIILFCPTEIIYGGEADFSTGAVRGLTLVLLMMLSYNSERAYACARAQTPLSLSLSRSLSLSLPPYLSSSSLPSLSLSSTRTKRSVMASSNHVTPTNCSWWPISALDEDGKITDGEDCEEPSSEPKPFSKDRLVLYHWTQSFTSQKVINTHTHTEHSVKIEVHGSASLCMP